MKTPEHCFCHFLNPALPAAFRSARARTVGLPDLDQYLAVHAPHFAKINVKAC